jgi:predicted acetyltransferase
LPAPALTLRPLRPADEGAAAKAHAELAADGFVFLLDRDRVTGFDDYLDLLERQRRGTDERPDRVPSTFLVADVAGQLVGRTSIRHVLNAALEREGGHIGFGVRPAFRRRGHATQMLRLSLDHLGDLGVSRALLTCDDDNVGSRTVIERCGGRLHDIIRNTTDGPRMRRYWIG